MKYGIDNYTGNWQDSDGYRLEIIKIDDSHALASLFSPFGPPVSRPFWDGRDCIDMPVEYDEYYGDFRIQLWEKNKGFTLDLLYDPFLNSSDDGIEILAPSLSRYAKDEHLQKYYKLFGNLNYYKKDNSRTNPLHPTAAPRGG